MYEPGRRGRSARKFSGAQIANPGGGSTNYEQEVVGLVEGDRGKIANSQFARLAARGLFVSLNQEKSAFPPYSHQAHFFTGDLLQPQSVPAPGNTRSNLKGSLARAFPA